MQLIEGELMKTIFPLMLFSSVTLALETLDDEALGYVDGQSGITIEAIQGGITIDEIRYTDGDGNGTTHLNPGSIVLSDISIGESSVKTEIDVINTTDGSYLNLRFSDIQEGDIWVRNIALGDENTTFGAVGITNFFFDPTGSYTVRIGSYDPGGGADSYPAIIYNFDMASSSFDFTFVEEGEFAADGSLVDGLQFGYTNQFRDFVANDTRIYLDDNIDGTDKPWAKLSLGDIQGSVELRNLTLGSGANARVMGSAGFSGAQIQDSSFIAITAH